MYLTQFYIQPIGDKLSYTHRNGGKRPVDRTLFERNSVLSKRYGINLISQDARIILYVQAHAGCAIKDAQFNIGLSHRGFYLKLQKLVEAGYIVTARDPDDGRRRQLRVTDKGEAFVAALASPATNPQDR